MLRALTMDIIGDFCVEEDGFVQGERHVHVAVHRKAKGNSVLSPALHFRRHFRCRSTRPVSFSEHQGGIAMWQSRKGKDTFQPHSIQDAGEFCGARSFICPSHDLI